MFGTDFEKPLLKVCEVVPGCPVRFLLKYWNHAYSVVFSRLTCQMSRASRRHDGMDRHRSVGSIWRFGGTFLWNALEQTSQRLRIRSKMRQFELHSVPIEVPTGRQATRHALNQNMATSGLSRCCIQEIPVVGFAGVVVSVEVPQILDLSEAWTFRSMRARLEPVMDTTLPATDRTFGLW